MYNLNDEDTDLTHYGQSLADIEKFDEPSGFEFYDNDDEDRGDITGRQKIGLATNMYENIYFLKLYCKNLLILEPLNLLMFR